MSVSKWAYEPSKCDGDLCAGDCDLCSKANMETEEWVHDFIEIKSERLTDIEQRIFLAAISREEKVCSQIDEENKDGINLVSVCHSIKSKVKKSSLWERR